MKVWILTAAAAVCFLKAASAQCSNNPCTGTDYRSYSSCLKNKCPDAAESTDCSAPKCSSIDCKSCSSSSSCCQSCCRPKCACSSVSCNTCSSSSSSACCQTCCPKQDCCTSKKPEECCHTHPQQECCKDKSVPPAIPSITLPNITIIINQSAPIVYNTLNQSCGGVTTVRNNTHIVTTTGTCSNDPKPNQPCCIITHQPSCPQLLPIFHHCPPPVQNYACGTQCIIQPQVLIQLLPQVVQPQPVSLCYLYPVHLCPQHCYGSCTWHGHGHSGCFHTHQWPFISCPYGDGYYGGYGGYGGVVG